MNKTLKDTVIELRMQLGKAWMNFINYRSITNIEEFGKLRLMYNKIESGHKSRAKKLFDSLQSETRGKLPKWLWEYFYPNAIFRTFNEWHSRGRVVRKGEKSIRKDDTGIALFMLEQTVIPDHVQRARGKLIDAIYSASEAAPYDDDYADYDAINKELQSWNGTVSYPLKKQKENNDPYAYEPPFEYSTGYSG